MIFFLPLNKEDIAKASSGKCHIDLEDQNESKTAVQCSCHLLAMARCLTE
jgi:hypothetical protein